MALQRHLRALVERLGPRVLDDSDSLRAALDDYLDEGTASRGEINLLVDTVRLGAYRRLTEMVDGGADPSAAVVTAGDALAQERGSADLAGSRWAVAALGFAAGKVPEPEVQRWHPGTAQVPPPQPPSQGPLPPPTQQFGATPTQQFGAPTGQPYVQPQQSPQWQQPAQPYAAGYGQHQQQSKRSKAPLLIAVATVLALALVGAGAWWAFAGDDDGGDGGGDGGGSAASDEQAYCDAYRAAEDEFSSMDFNSLDDQQFDALRAKVSELERLAPTEVEDEWQTLAGALDELESILDDAGLSFDDLDELAQGQLPEGLDATELQALNERITELDQSGGFETAGDAIDADAQERCGIDSGESSN